MQFFHITYWEITWFWEGSWWLWTRTELWFGVITWEVMLLNFTQDVTNPASWVCVCLCFCPGVCFRCPGTHPVWLPGELACCEIDVHPHLYPISNLHTCPDHHLSPSKALTWHPFPAGSLAMNSMLCHSISLKLDRICFVVFLHIACLKLTSVCSVFSYSPGSFTPFPPGRRRIPLPHWIHLFTPINSPPLPATPPGYIYPFTFTCK